MNKISVFIVDDHEIMRDGIRAMLIGSSVKVLGDFPNPKLLMQRLEKQQCDVILMDINMPVMSGIEALELLKEQYSQIPVLMLSAETDEINIQKAVKNGALGFLPKDSPKDELIKAIETVSRYQNYFGSSILSVIFKGYVEQTKEQNTSVNLSERELEITKLLCDGCSYKQIGNQLFISPRTVENQKQAIFKKLQLENNAQLIKYAIKMGIIEL